MNDATSTGPGNSAHDLSALSTWLVDAGLHGLPVEELLDGFCRRVNEVGTAIKRAFLGMNTLHPMIRAHAMTWDIRSGTSPAFSFNHADIDNPVWQLSPFAQMLRDGIPQRRQHLQLPDEQLRSPVLIELKGAGMTEWLGQMFSFGPRNIQITGARTAKDADQLGVICSFTTDSPDGFSNADMATLQETLPLFALGVKATTMRSVGRGLLATYLGQDPADRVLSGTIFRGDVESVDAVLFYADLRAFTELADTLPGKALVTMLDDYFDCMARPVVSRGGEILKFMGDGLLATFGIGATSRAEVCRTALDAANEALVSVTTLNAARQAAGQPFAALDLALHVGEVLYGNVGTDARLDFTVIGPAVNEASRIELLCKSLGYNLLISDSFAEAATQCRGRLVSVGRHRLRGVSHDTELFTLFTGA
jgi:adenylate cyclase